MIAARHIKTLSFGLVLMSCLITVTSFLFYLFRPSEIIVVARDKKSTLKALPFSFALPKNSYQKIGAPFLSLEYSPPTLEIPDLRQILSFYGTNARPDAVADVPLLHFGLPEVKRPIPIPTGQKLYLSYQRKGSVPKYLFSENNQPTPLWVTAVAEDNEAEISVQMLDPEGNLVEDDSFSSFKMVAKEWVRQGAHNSKEVWELNKMRVDGTLLARQQARWYGEDVFLEKHGGDDYSHTLGKHRIDFGEGETIYSCFVKQGDCLAWEEGRWKEITPGNESLGKPLLHVRKTDDRIMSLDLWDESGHRKVPLTLIRTHEIWAKEALGREFKFLGSRTKSQCVFEIGDDKLLLKPDDWLILTQDGWRKLETEEEIDQFVDRKLSGTLFVFDGMMKKDERQVLMGTLFNPSRTDYEEMEIAIQQNSVQIIPGNNIQVNPSKSDHAYNK